MKRKETDLLTELVIDLNELTSAERKMYKLGGYIAGFKYAPKPIRKQNSTEVYYQCASKTVSDHQIIIPKDFDANRNIKFNLIDKTFLTTFAYLDFDMLCAVMERCKELGWDKE